MSWTVVFADAGRWRAIAEILSFDSKEAWQEALVKYPTMIGMFKGHHTASWVTSE